MSRIFMLLRDNRFQSFCTMVLATFFPLFANKFLGHTIFLQCEWGQCVFLWSDVHSLRTQGIMVRSFYFPPTPHRYFFWYYTPFSPSIRFAYFLKLLKSFTEAVPKVAKSGFLFECAALKGYSKVIRCWVQFQKFHYHTYQSTFVWYCLS